MALAARPGLAQFTATSPSSRPAMPLLQPPPLLPPAPPQVPLPPPRAARGNGMRSPPTSNLSAEGPDSSGGSPKQQQGHTISEAITQRKKWRQELPGCTSLKSKSGVEDDGENKSRNMRPRMHMHTNAYLRQQERPGSLQHSPPDCPGGAAPGPPGDAAPGQMHPLQPPACGAHTNAHKLVPTSTHTTHTR